MSIKDRESLQKHLQWALTLELSTLPPYLSALYSIPDGSNTMAAKLIQSVVMEEMLHMTLVANLLNAIGGKPRLNRAKYIPTYPTYLPHSDDSFLVELLPFSEQAIETFLNIERPAKPGASPEPEKYHTIGQFYEAIEQAFGKLERKYKKEGKTLFTGKQKHQVTGDVWYYGGGGGPIAVQDLKSATKALEEIAEQGEGLAHSIFDGDAEFGQEELAHYFKFKEIQLGQQYLETDTPASGPTGPELPVNWTARYPMRPNPKASEYKSQPAVHRLMVEFNQGYTDLLLALHTAFNGSPEALRDAVPLMYDLKYRAQTLMQIPSGDDDGTTAGPPFEFVS